MFHITARVAVLALPLRHAAATRALWALRPPSAALPAALAALAARPRWAPLARRALCSSSSSSSGAAPPKKPSRWARIKATAKEHGLTFVVFWTGTWVACGACIYGGMTLAGVDGTRLLAWADDRWPDIGLRERISAYADLDAASTKTIVNGLIAIELNELLEVVRLPLVIATTPRLSRWLRRSRK